MADEVTPLPQSWRTGLWSKDLNGDPIPNKPMTVEPEQEWMERNFPKWPWTSKRPKGSEL